MARSLLTATLAVSAIITNAALASPLAAIEGPPYNDPNRSVQKQQDAARDARALVRQGPKALRPIMGLMGDASGKVRDAVCRELLRWSEEDLAALSAGLRAKDDMVVRNIAEVLGGKPVPAAREDLEAALRQRRSPLTQAAIARALGIIADSQSLKALERFYKSARSPMEKAAGLTAITAVDPAHAIERLTTALAEGDLAQRIVALAHLAELDEPRAATAAAAAIVEKARGREAKRAPRLLFQALDVLTGLTDRGACADAIRAAIGTLVDRIGEEDGRAKHEIGVTLRALTGQHDIGDEAFAWKAWWEARAADFDPASVKPGEAGDGPGAMKTVTRYHGIPIYSKRLAFVLDLSGGMDNPIDRDDETSMRRLDYAKRELTKTLQSLEDDVATNIVFFGSTFDAATQGLVPLKKSRHAFVDFVSKQEVSSVANMYRSNIYDPLIMALDDPLIDTVFVLSEGYPTEGLYQSRSRFLAHLTEHNRLAKTRVNVLYIGSSDSPRSYMREIAESTGGRFFDVGERPDTSK